MRSQRSGLEGTIERPYENRPTPGGLDWACAFPGAGRAFGSSTGAWRLPLPDPSPETVRLPRYLWGRITYRLRGSKERTAPGHPETPQTIRRLVGARKPPSHAEPPFHTSKWRMESISGYHRRLSHYQPSLSITASPGSLFGSLFGLTQRGAAPKIQNFFAKTGCRETGAALQADRV